MKRRIMFLHYILQQPTDSLLFRCFEAQRCERIPGDWIGQVEQDLSEVNITLSLEEIKKYSKMCFKSLLKEKILKFAYIYLLKQKENQSKCSSIKFTELKIQDYLCSKLMTTQQKKI